MEIQTVRRGTVDLLFEAESDGQRFVMRGEGTAEAFPLAVRYLASNGQGHAVTVDPGESARRKAPAKRQMRSETRRQSPP